MIVFINILAIVALMMVGSVLTLQLQQKKDGPEKATIWGNSLAEREPLWVGALLLVALILRLWGFGVIPGGMNQDGAMAAVDAAALAKYGTDRFGMHMPVHFTAWGYGQMSVLMSYCMVPFIKVLGLNAWSVRLPILLVSMAGLAALYCLVRKVLGTGEALVLLAFACCNPWHFIQSRWALDCNMLPHMFVLGLAFLIYGVRGKRVSLWVSMVFFALCMYSYGIAFYTVPIFLAILCIYLVLHRLIKPWEVCVCVGIYALLSWPIYMTMFINAFQLDTVVTPFFTMARFPGSVRSGDILFFSKNIWEQLLNNLNSLVNVYLNGDNLPWNTTRGFGAVSRCFLPFLLLGLFECCRGMKKGQDEVKAGGCFAVFLWFVIGNVGGLITANVNVNRANLLIYPMIILTGMGICSVARCQKWFFGGIVGAYLLISVFFLGTYFTSQAKQLDHYFYKDFIEAVRYAGTESHCTQFVITPDTQYQGSARVSEILTLYALDVDARFYQGLDLDENGLNYKEKFQYRSAIECTMDPSAPVAYIIRRSEKDLLPWDGYSFLDFGEYYAVLPNGTWGQVRCPILVP